MIFLQIFASLIFLLFVPIIVVSFNLYLMSRVYLSVIALLLLIFSNCLGLALASYKITLGVLALSMIAYGFRMHFLSMTYKNKKKSCLPVLQGSLSQKNYTVYFIFSFTFLKYFQWIFNYLDRHTDYRSQLNMKLGELTEVMLADCRGTIIELNSEKQKLHFFIK